jgi:hypothetical protein
MSPGAGPLMRRNSSWLDTIALATLVASYEP